MVGGWLYTEPVTSMS